MLSQPQGSGGWERGSGLGNVGTPEQAGPEALRARTKRQPESDPQSPGREPPPSQAGVLSESPSQPSPCPLISMEGRLGNSAVPGTRTLGWLQ